MAKKSDKVVEDGVDTDTVEAPGDVQVAQIAHSRQVIANRIKSGDARPTLMQVPLKKQPEPMTTRWANTSISGRAYELAEQKGWIPVRYGELANPGNGEFKRTPEGLVCRGVGGHQVLYKIPSGLYKEIAVAKGRRERERLGSQKAMASGAAEAAGTAGNHRAAERIATLGVEKFNATRTFEEQAD